MIGSPEVHLGKILIVDDQLPNVMLLDRVVRGDGYTHVFSTTDPHQVAALHDKHQFDLIMLDLAMPGMDGFQVMEALGKVETAGYLPVLVITAEPAHKLRALKSGAKDFLSKPLDLGEVLVRVYNLIELRLLHAALRVLEGHGRARKPAAQKTAPKATKRQPAATPGKRAAAAKRR